MAASWLVVRVRAGAPVLRLLCIDAHAVWTIDPHGGAVTARRSMSSVAAVGVDARGTGLIRITYELASRGRQAYREMTLRTLETAAAAHVAACLRHRGTNVGDVDSSAEFFTASSALLLRGRAVPHDACQHSASQHILALSHSHIMDVVVGCGTVGQPQAAQEPAVRHQWHFRDLNFVSCTADGNFSLFFCTGHELSFRVEECEQPSRCLAVLLGRAAAAAATAAERTPTNNAHRRAPGSVWFDRDDDEGCEPVDGDRSGADHETVAFLHLGGASTEEVISAQLRKYAVLVHDCVSTVWRPYWAKIKREAGADGVIAASLQLLPCGNEASAATVTAPVEERRWVTSAGVVELPLHKAKVFAEQEQPQRVAAVAEASGSSNNVVPPIKLQLLVPGSNEPLVLGAHDIAQFEAWLGALHLAICSAQHGAAGADSTDRNAYGNDVNDSMRRTWLASSMLTSLSAGSVEHGTPPPPPIAVHGASSRARVGLHSAAVLATAAAVPVAISGWLHVRDRKRNWRRRWCQLREDTRDLLVFKRPDDASLGQKVRFICPTSGCVAKPAHDDKDGVNAGSAESHFFRWTLFNDNGQLVTDFGAENEGDQSQWCALVNCGAR